MRRGLGVASAVLLGTSALWATSCIEPLSLQSDIAARLAEAVCNEGCGCGGQACSDWALEEGARLASQAEMFDLVFDEECLSRRIAAHADNGCQPTSQDEELRCGVGCNLLHGDRGIGNNCVGGVGFSNCDPGLVCSDGFCADPCSDSAAGRSCVDFQCEFPTRCDFESEICVAPPREGEACLNGSQCEGGLECIAGTCSGPRGDGEACMGHSQCTSRNCPAGFCAPRPAAGESCRGQVPCATGLACEDDVCVETPQPGDPCPCGINQACHNGVCRYNGALQCGGSFLVR